MDKQENGLKLEQEGDKILARRFYFFGNKYDDAISKYKSAVNIYKYNKLWDDAAKLYIKISNCYKQIDDQHEQMSVLIGAYKCYKQTNPNMSIPIILQLVDYYKQDCNFRKIISLYEEITQIYGKNNIVESYEYYKKIVEMCDYGEEFNRIKIKYNIKIANYLVTTESYSDASILYDNIAQYYITETLLKYSAHNFFLQAGLCLLCMDDIVSATRYLEKYCTSCMDNSTQKEYKFFENIVTCYRKNNIDEFMNTINDYESTNKLSNYLVNLLVVIKRNFNGSLLL